METRMNLESLCCINEECKEYGIKGRGNLTIRKTYGRDKIRYLRCSKCGSEFSERKGTALLNSKIAESKAVAILAHLDSRCGVVATAQLVKVAKETVSRFNKVTGKVFEKLHDNLVQDIRPKALQFDEKWSFVGKKQKHITIIDDEQELGDYWDCNCIDPQSKLLVSLITGKRTAQTITELVQDAAYRLASDCLIPAIFTDGEDAYINAVLAAFGNSYPAPRISHLGRPPLPIIRAPHDLVMAQIIKHREGGKVKQVEIRPIFGKGKLDSVVEMLGWHKANTSAIERFNLTDRARNARKGRKSLNFSRSKLQHKAHSFISVVLYNFHHHHRSLTIKTVEQHLKRTPAQAAGLTSRQFSLLELLRLNPIAC
jgi:IS1 family transposase/transposase-like protein